MRHRCRSTAVVGSLLVALFLGACTTSDGDIPVGTAEGVFVIDNAPAVAQAMSPAAPDPGESVTATHPLNFSVSRTAYALPDAPPAVAKYSILPPATTNGIEYLIGGRIAFTNGATYRFGSSFQQSPDAVACTVRTDQTATCDVSECAAAPEFRIELTGEVAALDEGEDVRCIVTALVEEAPGSPLQEQASTGELTGPAGQAILGRILVRGDRGVRLRASCLARPDPVEGNAPRFVVDADGNVPLVSELQPILAIPCGAAPAVTLLVRVERNAGVVKGLFDLSGETETEAEIRIDDSAAFSLEPLLYAGDEEPDPAQPWVFEGIPPGEHSIRARALFRSRRARLELPHRDGPNQKIDVLTGQTVDLGRTFVVRPRRARGRIVAYDVNGWSGLADLVTQAFENVGDENTTYVGAAGEPDQLNPGISGFGARAAAVPSGSYSLVTHQANLDYALFVGGLSTRGFPPDYAPLDGRTAQRVEWELDSFKLFTRLDLSPPLVRTVDVAIDERVAFEVTPPAADDVTEIEIPEQRICFAGYELQLGAARGREFFQPEGTIGATGSSVPADGDSIVSVRSAYAQGGPWLEANAADTVFLAFTLPAGLAYPVSGKVRVVNPGAGSTEIPLPPQPAAGRLVCGELRRECLLVDPENPDETRRTRVHIEPSQPICSTTGSVSFQIVVEATAGPLELLKYRVVPGPPGGLPPDRCGIQGNTAQDVVICTGCASGVYPVNNLAVPPGGGTVHVFARAPQVPDVPDCCAADSLAVTAAQPLTLSCVRRRVVALLPTESAIPADDSRITNALADAVTAAGSCSVPVIERELPGSFPEGDTPVTFRSDGGLSCSVVVSAVKNVHDVALLDDNALRVYRLDDGQWIFRRMLHGPRGFEYDWSGRWIAAIERDQVRIFEPDLDRQDGAPFAGNFSSVAFRPDRVRELAMVEWIAAPGGGEWRLVLTSASGSLRTLATAAAGQVTPPQIFWSPDGNRLAAAFTVRTSGMTSLHFQEFDVSQDVLGAPAAAWAHELSELPQRVLALARHASGDSRYQILTEYGWVVMNRDGTVVDTRALFGGTVASARDHVIISAVRGDPDDSVFLSTNAPRWIVPRRTILGVAVNTRGPHFAVSNPDDIHVYEPTTMPIPLHEIEVGNVRHLRFRP